MDGQSETKNLEVLIDGRVYTLAGSCPEEHLQRIGRYIDRRISEARRVKPIKSYNFDLNTLFIIINTVDDLLSKADQVSGLENEIKKLNASNEWLNKQLTDTEILLEDANKQQESLRRQLSEMQISLDKESSIIEGLKRQLSETKSLLEKEKKESSKQRYETEKNYNEKVEPDKKATGK